MDFGEKEQEAALPGNAGAGDRMAHKLKSKEGAKPYALRKQTVEPAFGIIKQCMRFRQFLMRGKERVSLEWNLVCSAYNMKRLFNLTRTGVKEANQELPLDRIPSSLETLWRCCQIFLNSGQPSAIRASAMQLSGIGHYLRPIARLPDSPRSPEIYRCRILVTNV